MSEVIFKSMHTKVTQTHVIHKNRTFPVDAIDGIQISRFFRWGYLIIGGIFGLLFYFGALKNGATNDEANGVGLFMGSFGFLLPIYQYFADEALQVSIIVSGKTIKLDDYESRESAEKIKSEILNVISAAPRETTTSVEHTTNMASSDGNYSTQQMTSKNIKGQILMAYALGIVGFLLIFLLPSEQKIFAALTIVAAILWRGILTFRTWWEHG